tara:strand:- start:36 stop:245 length:210 start_codon:yes stop_codon:yes gene_type:complete
MSITIEELESERVKLRKDFDDLKDKIGKVEIDLGTMKANLNALNGALQFSTNLITLATNKEVVKEEKKK